MARCWLGMCRPSRAAALLPLAGFGRHACCSASQPLHNQTVRAHARCDGPLLRALKGGAWVLLDELNLASQSVLEGLNAVLDHREEVR